MSGEKNLTILLKGLQPVLNTGVYVFATVSDFEKIGRKDTLFEFKEAEGITVVLEKNKAQALKLAYQFESAWITLKIHSSIEAVGLTAAFSTALITHQISCNVVAGYYHDHIFVDTQDAQTALEILTKLAKT
jgi:hypothetical protein|tara:strand:+ start:1051 stop:1446 length:396 start_codon:yes stop_codon:yes gene_type:complete